MRLQAESERTAYRGHGRLVYTVVITEERNLRLDRVCRGYALVARELHVVVT